MKKLLLFITTILFVININAQIVNIPDTLFKAALVNNSSINTNMDTEIQVSEAISFNGDIDVEGVGIHDLAGIEAFIALRRLYCGDNFLTTLDLSYNTELILLDCGQNYLSSLNLGNNFVLESVFCWINQLTSLDISNNPTVKDVDCHNNQITNLVLNNNPAFTYLDCRANQISSLDVSQYPALITLKCAENNITSIDVSNNTGLYWLICEYNQLRSLNIRNGNNLNMNIDMSDNPDLYCVEVDEPLWFETNTNHDPQVVFGYNCLYGIADPDSISGKILIDDNCVIDSTETGLEGIIVKTEPYNFYSITNNLGEYSIYTDTGTYQVEQIIPQANGLLINPLCPVPNYHIVHFDSLGMDTSGIDFFNEGIACPYLIVDVNSNRRRRCFTSNTYVYYCNNGFADATGVEIHVQLPDYVEFISSNYPFSIDTSGNYVFDIGNLAQGDCGDIHIIDSVACINGIIGLTQCTEAWITPANDFANQLDTVSYNQWDHSSVMVEGECMGDTIIRFVITNTGALGSGDMQIASEYRVFRNTLLVYTGTFQLLGQEELIIDIPADGATYRLEADQHPMHPGNSHPNETIENCGSPYNTNGLVDVFPQDDEDAEVEIDCMQIVDSYDPNDKKVSPEGFTANNYIMPGTELDYVIRFQNTGTAEAVNIVVVDTLSEYLDLATFQTGISSHPYTLDVRGHGQPVLLFQFFNINLPDSTTNEANSHGFVKFKIAPYDTLPNGTIVENTADIYFDYNVPVVTNTTFVTISDTVLYGNPLVIQDTKESIIDVKIFPNPTKGKLNIVGDGIERIEILNIEGRMVYTGKENEIDLSQKAKGIFIVKVTTDRGVDVEKIVLE